MLVGHYALGLALRKIAPQISLGLLFLSVQLIDLVHLILSILGIENAKLKIVFDGYNAYDLYYPYSHSLVGAIILSILGGLLISKLQKMYRVSNKYTWPIFSFAIFSHFLLDVLVHTDMPLIFADFVSVGLGLGSNIYLQSIFEITLLLVGVTIYLKQTRDRNLAGNVLFVMAILIFLLLLISGHMSAMNSDLPTPSIELTVAVLSMQIVLIAFGFAIDRYRKKI